MSQCFLCTRVDGTEKCVHCGLVSFCRDHRVLHRQPGPGVDYCYPYKACYDRELGERVHHTVHQTCTAC